MKHSGTEAPPTIMDVAVHAGVSRATASRALSGYGVVNAATRDRVRAAAEQLGYVPNVLARSMRAGKTQTIGLIITEVGLSVFDLAMRAVIEAAHSKGYQVLVANTNEDSTAERESVRVMLEKQVDGLILVPSSVSDLDFISPPALRGKPIVLLDRNIQSLNIPSVSADNRTGLQDALAHLLKNGHSKIGLVVVTAHVQGETTARPEQLVSTLHDRTEGYLEGMAAAGLKVHDQWVWFAEDGGESARRAARNLLDCDDPPTAIIGSNANVSLALLSVAKERALVVGRDISLIGFDDAPWASVLTPGLSVIDLPIEQMAKAAVDNLIAQIAATDTPAPATSATQTSATQTSATQALAPHRFAGPSLSGDSIVIPMRLILRGSVGAPALNP